MYVCTSQPELQIKSWFKNILLQEFIIRALLYIGSLTTFFVSFIEETF